MLRHPWERGDGLIVQFHGVVRTGTPGGLRSRLRAFMASFGRWLADRSDAPKGSCKWCGNAIAGEEDECRQCMLESMLGP